MREIAEVINVQALRGVERILHKISSSELDVQGKRTVSPEFWVHSQQTMNLPGHYTCAYTWNAMADSTRIKERRSSALP
jgi:hypothetical protein